MTMRAESDRNSVPEEEGSLLKKCEDFFLDVCAWFPIAMVAAFVIYAYYVYAIEFCFLTLIGEDPPTQDVVKAVLYLVFGHILLVLFIINYLFTAFRSAGSPKDFNLVVARSAHEPVGWSEDYVPTSRNRIESADNNEDGAGNESKKKKTFILPMDNDRYCGICMTPKPERCHHCSICGECRLKMDHHCPWFNNCIGYRNYKYFMSTCLYGTALCAFIFGTLLQELIWQLVAGQTKGGKSIQMLVVCVLSYVFGFSCAMLGFYHVYLAAINRTTIESLDRDRAKRRNPREPLPDNPYDLGILKNYAQVFGRNPLVWFLPFYYDGANHGLEFPKNAQSQSEMSEVPAIPV